MPSENTILVSLYLSSSSKDTTLLGHSFRPHPINPPFSGSASPSAFLIRLPFSQTNLLPLSSIPAPTDFHSPHSCSTISPWAWNLYCFTASHPQTLFWASPSILKTPLILTPFTDIYSEAPNFCPQHLPSQTPSPIRPSYHLATSHPKPV